MKIYRFSIIILCLILLSACAYDKEEMQTAWSACKSATGTPTGNRVSGIVYEIDSVNGSELSDVFTHREYGPGIYGYTYIDEAYDNVTLDLTKASAVLCAEITTNLNNRCNYPSNADVKFTLNNYNIEVQLTLLDWPSGELIARTFLENEYTDSSCPISVLHDKSEKYRDVFAIVDLKSWLDQYVTIEE